MPSVSIALGGTGDTTLVAAPGPNQFIRVIGYNLTANATSTVTLKSNATVKATHYLGAGNSIQDRDINAGVFDCTNGDPLIINNSAASIGGSLSYVVKGPSS